MPNQPMHPVLRELFTIAQQSPDTFVAVTHARGPELTQEVAEQARQIYGDAVQAGQLGTATVAAGIAATAYLFLGNPTEHLRCRFYMDQVRYMEADTLQAYLELKDELDQLAADAKSVGATEVRFLAMSYSANCLYFARETTDDPQLSTSLMLATLEQVNNVMTIGKPLANMEHLDAFMSLLAGTVDKAAVGVWVDDKLTYRETLLRRLAKSVETTIPPNYQFSGDPAKSVTIARTLANLSFRYGNPTAGNARLAAAAENLGA